VGIIVTKTKNKTYNPGGSVMLKKGGGSKTNLMYFFGGVLSCLALFFLTGAASQAPTGRYELEVVTRDRLTQIYVIDTSTGAVKWVDSMNTPFAELKEN
jgi:hypothetical protein